MSSRTLFCTGSRAEMEQGRCWVLEAQQVPQLRLICSKMEQIDSAFFTGFIWTYTFLIITKEDTYQEKDSSKEDIAAPGLYDIYFFTSTSDLCTPYHQTPTFTQAMSQNRVPIFYVFCPNSASTICKTEVTWILQF